MKVYVVTVSADSYNGHIYDHVVTVCRDRDDACRAITTCIGELEEVCDIVEDGKWLSEDCFVCRAYEKSSGYDFVDNTYCIEEKELV